jgi:hypothetical protein
LLFPQSSKSPPWILSKKPVLWFTNSGDDEEARIAAERICQGRFPGVAALVTAFHTEK